MKQRVVVASGLAAVLLMVVPPVVRAQDTGGSDQAAATPTPAPEGDKTETKYVNTLRWTTASEVDNFGFDIYRSLNEDGPFERVTSEPIPGAGTVDEPQSYVFVDDTIDPSKGYYYYIESISIDGVREKFSPVTYVKPKKPPETESKPADEDTSTDQAKG